MDDRSFRLGDHVRYPPCEKNLKRVSVRYSLRTIIACATLASLIFALFHSKVDVIITCSEFTQSELLIAVQADDLVDIVALTYPRNGELLGFAGYTTVIKRARVMENPKWDGGTMVYNVRMSLINRIKLLGYSNFRVKSSLTNELIEKFSEQFNAETHF